jgi:hypothetical protein
MSTITRRYDIDWLRVIAIGLLLVYHVAIGFQPWGIMVGFITNDKPWPSLWLPMSMLNVWRIPFLFFVSGMGTYLSMQRRNWKQLLGERTKRILLPYVFGMFCVFPVSSFIWQYNNEWPLQYAANPGHLWFLGNIFIYVVLLAPILFYLKKNENGNLVAWIKKVFSTPLGLIPVMAVFIGEALLMQPNPYELYAMTMHGFVLGLLAFFVGFCFMIAGDNFWKMLQAWKWMFVTLAAGLFAARLIAYGMRAPGYLIAVESQCWIFGLLAFGSKYLNQGGATLNYLSQAAYPVYIIHMIFLFLGSLIVFRFDLVPPIEFILVLLFTLVGSLGFYEFVIRRISILRPLFGVKMDDDSKVTSLQTEP